jgi:Cu+-exporting ATPase
MSVLALPGGSENELLRLAASLERGSEHPLAAAIVTGAQARESSSRRCTFASITGKGVTGEVNGRQVMLGNRALFTEIWHRVGDLVQRAETLRQEGQTVMFVASMLQPAGLLG